MTDEPKPSPQSHHSSDSLLDSIGRRTGRVPRTSLQDTDGDDQSPILDPRVASFQDQLRTDDRAKYRVVGEIASGGMGVVLRGHDAELGRDVAMKVVHEQFADRPEVIERFVEEAQIGGQLQHPGIVPVYELGLMSDERPYFTMKLVKGHTLAKLLARRKTVVEDRARFLSIFESVCQTMAYAHSKGVIHRDLKPANVMVGSFGEAQVVDWGLSKVLGRGGVADEVLTQDTALSVIETVRSGPQTGSDSIVGNVLGTPPYMSPEQARGEVERLDERTDVFALGAILCELLTGAPPYVESEGRNVVQMAAMAELDEARARIDAADAGDGLKSLCLACLAPSKKARPSSAEEVAEGVHDHLAGLETAAHEAQLSAAEQRYAAERSRRQLQLALAAASIAALVGCGLWWTGTQRRARVAEVAAAYDEARTDALDRERAGEYEMAVDAARAGLRLVEAGEADTALVGRARALVTDAESALRAAREREANEERERRLLAFLTDAEVRAFDVDRNPEGEALDNAYVEAFHDFGIDPTAPDLARRLEKLRDTELGLAIALGADGWIRLKRNARFDASVEIEVLNSIALDLDPDPFRTEVRLALADRDRDRLLELAESVDFDGVAAETFVLLNSTLRAYGHYDAALAMAVAGADRHPTHFLLNYEAGSALFRSNASRTSRETEARREAPPYLRAAIALRPDISSVYQTLGDYHRVTGNAVLAARWTAKAIEMDPDTSWAAGVIAWDLMEIGHFEDALEWYELQEREQFESPDDASSHRLCRVALGRSTIPEYIAWTESTESYGPEKWAGPAYALCGQIPGLEPDPEQALELMAPFIAAGGDDRWSWMVLARVRVLVGDGAGALDAIARVESAHSLRHQTILCRCALLRAAAHRMEGNDGQAETELKRARRIRGDLMAGDERSWAGSSLARDLAIFEPIADGN